jgi:2-C-methyl-D-erythritol 4-phosphate cytidylyltransferase
MDITGIKLKYLSEKKNEYGTNHFFELLDEKPLKELIKLQETDKDIKIPVWEYNNKYYLKFNDKRLCEYSVNRFNEDETNGIEEIVFKQDIPYIMDLTFKEYNFKKQNETIKGYTISEINKIY